jgi:hypothetical protein
MEMGMRHWHAQTAATQNRRAIMMMMDSVNASPQISNMAACCASSQSRSAVPPSSISPQISALVADILKRIPSAHRGVYFSVVLDARGEVVAMGNTRAERPDELLAHVARVKRAALEYGACRLFFVHGI